MRQLKHYTACLTFICLLFTSPLLFAQQRELSTEEVEEYKEQSRQMVSFLQYMMNTLGSASATTQAKETIINQSYSKAFVDADVQIEDDLDEERAVITNKNVQAYLKDIDFFFKDASFELNVDDVSYYVNDEGKVFFRVTVNRNLQGTTVNNDTINANQLRFIEINLDRAEKQLKIASIYTTKLSEREELANWWNEVPYDWQEIFKKEIGVVIDTVNFRMLREIINLDELDVSGNRYIETLEPLSRMYNLSYLDVSGTNIQDIVPLRNLTKLQTLNLSDTDISSLEPLKYSTDLRALLASNTRISDLSILTNFSKLEKLVINGAPVYQLASLRGLKELRCANTAITSLVDLANLTSLEYLDCSSTNVKDLSSLQNLQNLERLSIEYTPVSDLTPLAQLKQLRILRMNNTPVNSLRPLDNLSQLERIYCDDTPITRDEASRFMMANEQALVIFESKQLQSWWDGLDAYWKEIFSEYVNTDSLTQETLAAIANLTEIDISERLEITTLEPLRQLQNLKELNCANTSVSSLEPLTNLIDLQILDASATLIDSLGALSNARNLRKLNIDNTGVGSLIALADLEYMQYMSCEHTELSEPQVIQFIREHPSCLVIFKSDELSLWWNEALSPAWKDALRQQISISGIPSKEQLHEIVFMDKLVVANDPDIWDLSPVREFVNLRELEVTNTAVADLTPIGQMYSLEKLVISRNPVKSLEPISKLTSLEYLDFQDTPIEDLKPIRNFIELETLICSSTQVSKLKHISSLINLKVLDCSGTQVKKLKHIRDLYQLEELIVYNTRVSEKEASEYRREHPDVSVNYY
jgi:Leucine-rich repeat (LRR) protein